MSTQSFIQGIASLLLRYDDGMLEFEEPPPDGVADGLMKAILAFGDICASVLHQDQSGKNGRVTNSYY